MAICERCSAPCRRSRPPIGTELSDLHGHGLNFMWVAGASGWDGSKALIASGQADMVQGIIPQGGAWNGIVWPWISGLDYDPNVIYSADVGQIAPLTAFTV